MREPTAELRETQFTKREMGSSSLLRRLPLLVAIGLAVGWMGPFGTYYSLTLPQRLLYWTLDVPLVGLCAGLSLRLVMRYAPIAHWPLAGRVLLGAALAACPATLIIVTLNQTIGKPRPMELAYLLEVLITAGVVIVLIAYPLARRLQRQQPVSAARPEPPIDSPFLRRIPPRLGTALISLTAEDHYVRVTTRDGSDLVLCRLSDAVAELAPGLGERVHRSWWVAKEAVASVERQNGKTILHLVSGERVPVSQSYEPALKSAGWL